MTGDGNKGALLELLNYLKVTRGFDFSVYKRSTLERRISKRMADVGVSDYLDYLDYLEVHPNEFELLFNTIQINVTSFFRDTGPWEFIRSEIAPRLIDQKADADPIRVWSAGCSSGEEAYSIAMVLAECLGRDAFRERVKIYATDVDQDALATARQATYGARSIGAIPNELREKYFEQTGTRFTFSKELRRNIIFGRHDLSTDAPISRVDLLISRNTLMYFNAEAQARILERLYFALSEHGFLFLGKAETMLTHAQMFTPVNLKARVFTKTRRPDGRDRIGAMILTPTPEERLTEAAEQDAVRELAFEADPVAQIIVDSRGMLAQVNRVARELFELSPQSAGRPLQDLPVSYRPIELRSLIDEAVADLRPVFRREVPFPTPSGNERWLDVQIVPLRFDPSQRPAVKIAFTDTTRFRELQAELDKAHHSLETAYEELQSSNEELETTNEELQSTVEELETTNEELQATNEELETINEELQSTNEELETVNAELGERGDQLNEANSFLESILSSLQAGVIVVGLDMRVRAWNAKATDLWGLRPDEVRGEHLMDLDFGLPVSEFSQPLREAMLGTAGSSFMRDMQGVNRRGRPFSCRVTIEPLREDGQRTAGAMVVADNIEELSDPTA